MKSAKRIGKRLLYVLLTLSFLLIALFLIKLDRWEGGDGKAWKSIISGDAPGYLAYQEQIFDKHNLGSAPVDNDHVHPVGDRSVIKYGSGVSLLLLPAYAVADFFLPDVKHESGAFRSLYSKSISICALLYFLCATVFIVLLIRELKVSLGLGVISILLVFFGSNLIVYTLWHPAVSHLYSFFAISGFLYYTFLAKTRLKSRYFILSGLFLGLLYLIRPLDIVIVFILPIFFYAPGEMWQWLRKYFFHILMALLTAIIIGSLQHLLYYLQTGYYFLWPYQYEGFYFLHPEILNFLFSFRKGWFIYSPLLLVPLIGIFFIRMGRFRKLIFLLFVLLLVYILSAWWCWSYFDSYGMRPMVDFYPLFIIAFALLLARLKTIGRIILLFICLFPLTLNLLQSEQYRRGILHPEYMSASAYRYIFLNFSVQYEACVGGFHDLPRYDRFLETVIYDSSKDSLYGDTIKSVDFNRYHERGGLCCISEDSSLYNASGCRAIISFEKFDINAGAADQAQIVCCISYPDRRNDFYASVPLNDIPNVLPKTWVSSEFSLILPRLKEKEYEICFFIWNRGFENFRIKNYRIQILNSGFRRDQ